jgi:hypothetical protein
MTQVEVRVMDPLNSLELRFVCCFVLILFLLFFFLFEIGSHYIAELDLELKVLLSLPPEFWDYRHALTHLALKMNFLKNEYEIFSGFLSKRLETSEKMELIG